MDGLKALVSFVFSQFDSAWALYTGGSIVGLVLAVILLDKIFHIFDVLKR